MAMGQLENAIECFERALLIRSNFFEVLHDLGLALSLLNDWDKAIQFFILALEINPNSFEALTNLGNCYRNIRLFDKALSFQKQAVNKFPSNSIGWLNYGVTLQDLTNVDDALHCFNKAIELQPNYLEAHINKGNLFKTLRMFEQSSLSYKNAYEIFPDDPFLLGTLVFSKTTIADWSGLDSFKSDLISGISLDKPLAPPFTLLSLFDSPALHLKVANKWISDQYPQSFSLGPIQRNQNKKICIAYFSADFKSHPVSFLIAKLLAFEKPRLTSFQMKCIFGKS
jgi:predicted O-linked N-acetylglucosamine transferase (SPINDLY family)